MVCENMYQDVNTTMVDIVNCGTDAVFNGNFEFMALVALGILALLVFRLSTGRPEH